MSDRIDVLINVDEITREDDFKYERWLNVYGVVVNKSSVSGFI